MSGANQLAQIDAQAAQIGRLQAALRALVAPEHEHDYMGLCPDGQQPHERDPDCPACRELMRLVDPLVAALPPRAAATPVEQVTSGAAT